MGSPTPVIWLLDASAMVNIKKVVPGNRQWRLFRDLEDMVVEGLIAFPKQVKVEVTGMAHPDAPGVWADGVFPQIKYPTDPSGNFIRTVMASPAAAVVDPNKTREDGDPYLIAMSLELTSQGHQCCVVTDDIKDNPTRIALASACNILAVQWCSLSDFLTAIGCNHSQPGTN